MGNTAHDLALGDARVDRGPARRTASHQSSSDLSAIMNGGSAPIAARQTIADGP